MSTYTPAVRWLQARSPVGPGGELSDAGLFSWRPKVDAHARTVDQAAPRVVVPTLWPFSADLGLLLVRVVLSGFALVHGARVLAGQPGGPARSAAEATLSGYGFVRPDLLTTYLGWVQLVAGVLLLLGVFATFAGAALLAVTVTAVGLTVPVAWAAHAMGPVQGPLLTLTLTAVVVLAGPGRISGDAGRAWARQQTPVGLVGLFLGVATGLTVLFALR